MNGKDFSFNHQLVDMALRGASAGVSANELERRLEAHLNVNNRRRQLVPTITATVTNPTLTGAGWQGMIEYQQDGAWCKGTGRFVVGAAPTVGNGDYLFPLPLPAALPAGMTVWRVGQGFLYDGATGYFYPMSLSISTDGATVAVADIANDWASAFIRVTHASPAPVAGATYDWNLNYPVAGYPIAPV